MHTVKDIFGHKNKRGHVGIEVEVEAAKQLPPLEVKPWTCKPEQSLRGYGMEYITTGPILCNSDKTEALKALSDLLFDKYYKVDHDSPRTSVHVHVNVLGLTPTQVYTAACAYWLLENPLMKWCGPTREGNKFCLRLKDAEGILGLIKGDMRNVEKQQYLPFQSYKADYCKYGGLNLNAIGRFGSLEFRGLRGVYDTKTMDLWSTSMYTLVTRAAEAFESPSALMDYYYKHGPYRLISKLLEDDLVDQLTDIADGIEENAERVCHLAYMHNWTAWSKNTDEFIKKCKERSADSVMITANTLNWVSASGATLGATVMPQYAAIVAGTGTPDWQQAGATRHQIYDAARYKSMSMMQGGHSIFYKMYHMPFNLTVHDSACDTANQYYTRTSQKAWLDVYIKWYRKHYRTLVGEI